MGFRLLLRRWTRRRRTEWSGKLVWLATIVAAWGCAATVFGAGGLVELMRSRSELDDLAAQVAEAEAANAALEAEIEALGNDPAAIERVAREELLLGRPGETIYLLPTQPDESDDESIPEVGPDH